MGKILIIALAVGLIVIVGGGIFLASWNIPSPSSHVEKPIADEAMPR